MVSVMKKANISSTFDDLVIAIDTFAKQRGANEGERSVLVEMARGGLGTPPDQRHPLQVMAVDKIEEFLLSVRDTLQLALMNAHVRVAEWQQAGTALQAEKAITRQEINGRTAEERNAKVILANATRQVQVARQRLKIEETSQQRGNEGFASLVAEEKAHVTFLSDQFVLCRDSTSEDEFFKSVAISDVINFAKNFNVPDSLVASLSSALGKQPGSRWQFDLIALEQFEQMINEKIAEIAGKLETLGVEVAARQVVVDSAKDQLTVAKQSMIQAAASFRLSSAAHEKARFDLQSIEKLEAEHNASGELLAEALNNRQSDLDRLTNVVSATFGSIHQRFREPNVLPSKHISKECGFTLSHPAIAVGGQ
eukprot:TRINITY_DN75377_c0_g1_i1.p1 TRINITY_DN75377_c0_g1~~TRINITY_DN75377_c0_g1_i1.p1  ORF type:complete len:396 (-),score=85.01 TRINITY_DN75377_c0_g1_i1:57-1157(-)